MTFSIQVGALPVVNHLPTPLELNIVFFEAEGCPGHVLGFLGTPSMGVYFPLHGMPDQTIPTTSWDGIQV